MGKVQLTTEQFIERAKKAHGDRYDYSETVYTGIRNLVTIRCKLHGEFKQSALLHTLGSGCQECGGVKVITTEAFVKKAIEKHGSKYTYAKALVAGCKNKVTITCLIHGDFRQSVDNHLRGEGCPTCGLGSRGVYAVSGDKKIVKKRKNNFLKKARNVHNRKYRYTKVVYTGARQKVIITCPFHGDFEQRADNHLAGQGCMDCHLGVKAHE